MLNVSVDRAPGPLADPIRVFVGADENQQLAFRVLEYPIRRHSTIPVDIVSLGQFPMPTPADPRWRSRTGFTFQRFLIPALCGYRGRAIYLDADMLVFQDLADLWRWPMPDSIHLLYTRQHSERARLAAYAVMVLNCERLQWNIEEIIRSLDDAETDYQKLVYELDLVGESEKSAALPTDWNALEQYEARRTALIHFTDMPRQPWIYRYNPNGNRWYQALRDALDSGAIDAAEVAREIELGHVHPHLPRWIGRPELGVSKRGLGWLPPYLERIRSQRSDPYWKVSCAVRQWTVWAPWFRRLHGAIKRDHRASLT